MENKKQVGLVILLSNLFLAVAKISVWFLTGSVAVKSDGFNSLVDTVYSFIIITGFLISRRERTSDYPEGLVRLEPVVSIFVAIMIVLTGAKIAYDGVLSLISSSYAPPKFVLLSASVLVFSIIIKSIMYVYVKRKASKHNSPSLAATAVDNRNDVFISIIAVTGVFGYSIGFPEIEGIAAIMISIYVSYSGIRVAEENVEYALGGSVPEDVEKEIINAAQSHDKVRGVHDVNIHYTGPLIDVSMHLEIPGDMTIEEGHGIEIKTADNIRECSDEEINEINIHLDPDSLDEWKTEA